MPGAACAGLVNGGCSWAPHAYMIVRIAIACLGLGAALALAPHFRPLLEAPVAQLAVVGGHAKEITVLLVCLAGGLLYPALLFAFGGVTPAEARAALKRKKGDAPVTSDLP